MLSVKATLNTVSGHNFEDICITFPQGRVKGLGLLIKDHTANAISNKTISTKMIFLFGNPKWETSH